MSEYRSNNTLRDWAPLTDLLDKLPKSIKHGLSSKTVKLTSIDVLPEFIALGTNAGIVYWYNRIKRDLQRLRCDNPNAQITTVKVISTVEYMLACGTSNGNINIFQIPKEHPDTLPLNLRPKNQQMERYVVSDMHKNEITALEWSKNGMKLFSGDKDGTVVLTEIDFYMHISKSIEILNEGHEIVQLSYYQQNLLISTIYRSIICKKEDKWKITQVGKKDRKVFGDFGGVIHTDGIPNNAYIYCTRPSLRLWISDMEGNIASTIRFGDFKEILSNPRKDSAGFNQERTAAVINEPSFGILKSFKEHLLVTYTTRLLYVLDPKTKDLIHKSCSTKGILDVATTKNEIFILENDRHIVRLAYEPEAFNHASHFTLPSKTLNFLSTPSRLLETAVDGVVTTQIPRYKDVGASSVVNAEEALDYEDALSSIRNVESKILKNENSTVYNKISKEDYDDSIVYKHHKPSKNFVAGAGSNAHPSRAVPNSLTGDARTFAGTVMNMSTVSIQPDLRSPESIMSEIIEKEKLLAEELDFDKVKLKLNKNEDNADGGETIRKKIDLEQRKTFEDDCLNSARSCDGLKARSEEELKESRAEPEVTAKQSESEERSRDVIPDVVDIPIKWNLSNLTVQDETLLADVDISLKDWEII